MFVCFVMFSGGDAKFQSERFGEVQTHTLEKEQGAH